MQSDIVSSESPNKRIAYIDVAKSICLFLMIVGHMGVIGITIFSVFC